MRRASGLYSRKRLLRPSRHGLVSSTLANFLSDISALFEDINKAFDAEMEKHVEALGGVEKSVRIATRSLADRRQQVDLTRTKLATLEQQAERVENARRALDAPEMDWTGRTPLKAEATLPPAFGFVPPAVPTAAGTLKTPVEPPLPARGEPESLIQLRRIAQWEERVATLLEERAAELEGDGADRALKYRKVIALCAKVSVDQVDDVSPVSRNFLEALGSLRSSCFSALGYHDPTCRCGPFNADSATLVHSVGTTFPHGLFPRCERRAAIRTRSVVLAVFLFAQPHTPRGDCLPRAVHAVDVAARRHVACLRRHVCGGHPADSAETSGLERAPCPRHVIHDVAPHLSCHFSEPKLTSRRC